VPLIGLKLSDLNLGAVVANQRLDIQGQGNVGGGRLEVSGDFELGPAGLSGQLRAGGERLTVADTKEYFVVASPSFGVRVDQAGTRVRGELKIPEARIRPRAIPAGTVSVSPDVEMIDQAREEKGGLPLDIDVMVRMGNEVAIDAFGVRGRLEGALRVLQPPGKELLGDGQLGIVDGVYRITAGLGLSAEIGAPLTIEQGRLIWAKSPIGNPGLLLQAQREGGDTTAGVRVLGTIRSPKLAFFSDSDPDMSRSEITTYLLTGVPPKRDAGADRSLSLGTYVAPKLYMEYENGLGDEQDKVKLRYDLSRRIELQTETGESQGGDIFFKFER
jgi:translocation and assembly module TamB